MGASLREGISPGPRSSDLSGYGVHAFANYQGVTPVFSNVAITLRVAYFTLNGALFHVYLSFDGRLRKTLSACSSTGAYSVPARA